jgi:hypothetical protein
VEGNDGAFPLPPLSLSLSLLDLFWCGAEILSSFGLVSYRPLHFAPAILQCRLPLTLTVSSPLHLHCEHIAHTVPSYRSSIPLPA